MNDNEMIAQFMGIKYSEMVNGHIQLLLNKRSFNTSWDWLMPVVCKIDDLFGDDDYIDDQINKVHNAVLQFDNEIVHRAIVQFIRENEIRMWQLDNGFPFMEGDDYWVIEDDGTLSTLSCWDDMSEEMHLENPIRKYFSSEEEGLKYIKSQKI